MRNGRAFFLLGAILLSALLAAGILIAASPPRGRPVELLPAPTPAPLVVDVGGSVNRPGLYTLKPGSRIEDAIEAAGGLTPDADASQVNRSALLMDGEKIVVPAAGQELPALQTGETNTEENRKPVIKVNLNTATLEEIMELPGIGETKAERIIAYRDSHSGFKTIDEIQEVEGIGPETFEKLREYLTLN